MNTTTKTTTPALLTEATEAEVSEALLRHATRNYPGAVLVEHQGVVPPVGPEHVTYRLGALEVEELGWSAGGAKVSQRIDLWVPDAPFDTDAATRTAGAMHAALGEVGKLDRQAVLSDGTTVLSGTYTVEVFPFVPLIEGRSEQAPRVALGDRHRGRKVGKVGPVEGKPGHRTQRVELGVTVRGDVRPVIDELRGKDTAAGHISGVEYISGSADQIGGGSFAAATASRDMNVIQLAVTLQWREA